MKRTTMKVGALAMIAAMALMAVPATIATHQQRTSATTPTCVAGEVIGGVTCSGWLSYRGLAFAPADGGPDLSDEGYDGQAVTGYTLHGGDDGPAEPNFGYSRPGGDKGSDSANAGALAMAGGSASVSGGHTYTALCGASVEAGDVAAYGPTFTENVGDMTAMRGTPGTAPTLATASMFLNNHWYTGIPLGSDLNWGVRDTDDNPAENGGAGPDGLSDVAQAYHTQVAMPRIIQTAASEEATASWSILQAGTWADVNRDAFVDTLDPLEWDNTSATAPDHPEFKGMLDPMTFIITQIDPNDGLGTILTSLDNILAALTPPGVPDINLTKLQPCADVLNNAPFPPLPDPGFPTAYPATLLAWVTGELVPWLTTQLALDVAACVAAIQDFVNNEFIPWLNAMIAFILAAPTTVPAFVLAAAGAVVAEVPNLVLGVTQLLTGDILGIAVPLPVSVESQLNGHCFWDFGFINRDDGEYESNANFNFVRFSSTGRQVTTVVIYDGTLDGTEDRVDIDQYCTSGQASGSGSNGDGTTSDFTCGGASDSI